MGEMAEYMLNGDDCQGCGEYLGDGPGFPRWCEGCALAGPPPPAKAARPTARGPWPRPPGTPHAHNPPYASKTEKNRAKKRRRREREAAAAAGQQAGPLL